MTTNTNKTILNYKIENLELMQEAKSGRNIFTYEYTTSKEDKIKFLDSLHDGKMSYVLNLFDKFNQEKDFLPKQYRDKVKTVSLIAWIKRNDTKYSHKLFDTDYHYGECRFLTSGRFIQNIPNKPTYDTFDDYIDEAFHRQLNILLKEEKKYYAEHNPYEIKKTKLRKYIHRYNLTFGLCIVESSKDGLLLKVNDDENKPIPENIIDSLIDKFEQLEKFIDTLSYHKIGIED